MTQTQKTLLISAIIAAIVLWYANQKAKARAVTVPGGQLPAGAEQKLFYKTNSSFAAQKFYFQTPVGSFSITDPDTSSAEYHSLYSDGQYQFGWQAPTPGVIVVTLLPLQVAPIVENAIIDLNAQTVKFEYKQLS